MRLNDEEENSESRERKDFLYSHCVSEGEEAGADSSIFIDSSFS